MHALGLHSHFAVINHAPAGQQSPVPAGSDVQAVQPHDEGGAGVGPEVAVAAEPKGGGVNFDKAWQPGAVEGGQADGGDHSVLGQPPRQSRQ